MVQYIENRPHQPYVEIKAKNCTMVRLTKVSKFRDSSAVEQSPVKRLVVGSNPTRGAN